MPSIGMDGFDVLGTVNATTRPLHSSFRSAYHIIVVWSEPLADIHSLAVAPVPTTRIAS